MPTTVIDPYSILAEAIEVVLATEFSDIAYLNIVHDRLHESVGHDGKTWVGISPVSERTRGIDMYQTVLVQFYSPFTPDVDPWQQVDPRPMTNKAERLRVALSRARVIGQPEVWFFDVDDTVYPNDATGNKTKFEMTITGRGQNSALVETTA